MNAILILIFVLGYIAIATEHIIRVNKAAAALVTGVLLWTVYILFTPEKELVNEQLTHHLGDLSGILFFLLGAMTIVELIDAHEGFEIITSRIRATSQRKLLWIIGFITFFLSAVLDNLTTTIVIVSLLRRLIKDEKQRLFYAGIVVIAANAGGAWSPIGDVTTTMLWIGGQITAFNIMAEVIIPSIICLAVPLTWLSLRLKGHIERPSANASAIKFIPPRAEQSAIFFTGISMLIMVPVFKTLTHLPPYMGILIGLGILWIVTELIHAGKNEEDKHPLSVVHALRKIDAASILFFLGILVSISALESTGILNASAGWLSTNLPDQNVVVMAIGLLSSIVDNVPLVAAAQGMYETTYPVDHNFWTFLAYATGTGGSVLIIGSAAGIAAMGIEKIDFFWYLKKISLLALLGYLAGAGAYLLQKFLLTGM